MTINKGNLFVFEVGPSVKFVSVIKDAIFNKKMGVNFSRKKDKTGGGGIRGGFGKRPGFFRIFFTPSLNK